MRWFRHVLTLSAISVAASGSLLTAAEDAPTGKTPSTCIPAEKDKNRHEQFLKDKAKQLEAGAIQVVFTGDSITDGWRGGGKKVWEKNFGKYNPLNLGIGGDRTEHLLWRFDHAELDGLDPKAVVVMIGTNNMGNTADDIVAGVTCDVKSIHEKLPKAKILLLGIFPRSEKGTDFVRTKIKNINEQVAKLDGKNNVKYLDIGGKFLESDGTLPRSVMPDGLHPNEKGYEIWAEAIGPALEELTK